ncbi:MAG: hypothetical protein ACJA2W_000736 [Planctomycetota bacterium]|jgi:hypothetical protein
MMRAIAHRSFDLSQRDAPGFNSAYVNGWEGEPRP